MYKLLVHCLYMMVFISSQTHKLCVLIRNVISGKYCKKGCWYSFETTFLVNAVIQVVGTHLKRHFWLMLTGCW